MSPPVNLLSDAALRDDRPALWCDGRWYGYRELDARAARLAAVLAAQGIGRGDRVAILAYNHLAHIDLMLAAPRLGFVFMPLNYRLSAAEQRELVGRVAPRLLLADAAHAGAAADLHLPIWPLDQHESRLDTATAPIRTTAVDRDDIHMLLCTGGSTGVPKAARIPYRQILANNRNTAAGWALRADDCAIQATPCFHAALNVFTTPLLALGGRVALLDAFEPGRYLHALQACGATLMFMVPTMYQMLAEHPRFATTEFSRLRWAIAGGAPCPAPLRSRYAARGLHFRQGYGMTEAGVNCFHLPLDEAQQHPDSVGYPLPGTQAMIRRPDGTACAEGEVGELTLAGEHVCAGYEGRDEEWRQVFRDGWLWTGDLARRDAAGRHYIVGRRKEMYISGGENVYPAEVEAALAQLPDVAECAVVGVPDARWGEVGLAAVRLVAGARTDADALRAQLKQRLAGYKLPRHFLFLDELPKSGAGKLHKPAIRQIFERASGGLHEGSHPRD
ncbi:AMP-binding protein [Fontimonas sp. SYSU GA230001]|uniref:AMP-binding protein n=1 Tax=Fontimonas sp. SYSU GA230001 TaxID=3142450 RepID=UPI0032B571E3